MKTIFPRILATTALCLAALGVNSCVTIIDTGSMLDDVGKQSPSRQIRFVEEKKPLQSYYTGEKLQVWEKEGIYYVQLPVAYIPARVKNRDFLAGMSMYCSGKVITYPEETMGDEEVMPYQHTKEYFYAVLSKEQLDKAVNPYIKYSDSFYREHYAVLSAAEVDLSRAKKWQLTPSQKSELEKYAVTMIEQLPDRRTTGNQLRRPLALLLDIADVPLSIAATPIAWVADFIHVCVSD